jgi:DNA-binding IclR family transcriptional regulator
MTDDNGSRTIQSVAATTDIIEHIRDNNGGTVSGLADAVDLSPASIHSHLATLKQDGYIIQHGSEYNLGPQMLTLGEAVRNRSKLYQAAKQQVERLATELEESAHLIIEHDGKMFALYERFGSNAVGVKYHNRKREVPLNHMHCTAAGKSILSGLPDGRVEVILEKRGMPRNTENTITDTEALFDELVEIRERGYSFANEEQMEGIRAVGAPIFGPEEDIVGAIAVSGPASGFQGTRFREELPDKVTRAANICEINLRASNVD